MHEYIHAFCTKTDEYIHLFCTKTQEFHKTVKSPALNGKIHTYGRFIVNLIC